MMSSSSSDDRSIVNGSVDDDALVGWALHALGPQDVALVEAHLSTDPAASTRATALLEVLGRLHPIDAEGAQPSPSSVLAAALSQRPARQSLLSPAVTPPASDVMNEVARASANFVATLTSADLAQPTRLGVTVAEVLAHVIGQLERTATQLGHGTFPQIAPEVYDHWGSTEPYMVAHAGFDGPMLARAIRDVCGRIVNAADAVRGAHPTEPDAVAAMSFELWMHTDDVRLALGQAASTPTPGAVLAMCEHALSFIAAGVSAAERPMPGRTLRLVLTGPGGGTWLCALAADEVVAAGAVADAALIADGVTFCRLFHRQVSAEAVPLAVDGDRSVVDAVLIGAQALTQHSAVFRRSHEA